MIAMTIRFIVHLQNYGFNFEYSTRGVKSLWKCELLETGALFERDLMDSEK